MSCRNATALIEKKEATGLSLIEKLELRVHLTACKFCNQYNLQNKIISGFMKELNKKDDIKADDTVKPDPDFKQKMKHLVNSHLNGKT
ncbi:MAG TPA: hypothetical protein VIM16_24220 [Mucilaginibacter sp.]